MSAPEITGHRLGPVEAVPVGEGRAFAVAGEQVAVFPLADGQLDAAKVVCPLHLRAYAFADGSCPEGPGVAVYPARVVDGDIVVELTG